MKNFPILVAVAFAVLSSHAFALSVQTHEDINEYIVRNNMNGYSLNTYLQNNLGIVTGITTTFNSMQVWQWFRTGGHYEDLPPETMPFLRSKNHFHNPLKPLDQAGYSYLSGKSAIAWSQSLKGTQSPGGYYSWYDVRDYFYSALTGTDQNTRDSSFANTFRGVGQLMHLVQDMSVPEHARNDGHVAYAYEEWVRDKPSTLDNAYANAMFFNMAALTQPSPFGAAPVPIAKLFDNEQYYGNNPDPDITVNYQNVNGTITPVSNNMIGLSE